MSDPFSLVPLAIAARGGQVDGYATAQLVAAGVTLLQRSAPLVRALATGRSAILLPPSPAVLVALAASDGRGALVLNPETSSSLLQKRMADTDVRAVFTTTALADVVGSAHAVVLLDDAPDRIVVVAQGREVVIDVGSHFGIALEGEHDAPGRDEEFVLFDGDHSAPAESHSHRQLLTAARVWAREASAHADTPPPVLTSSIASLDGLLALLAPLLAGQSVRTWSGR
jgi:acyl-CoA synthetase (AMP-forming)/AMP-acid ligase II